jgi:hypothetical protein
VPREIQRTNKKTGKTVTLYYHNVMNKRSSQGTFCGQSVIKRLRRFAAFEIFQHSSVQIKHDVILPNFDKPNYIIYRKT